MKNTETCASVKDNVRTVFPMIYVHGSEGKIKQKNQTVTCALWGPPREYEKWFEKTM